MVSLGVRCKLANTVPKCRLAATVHVVALTGWSCGDMVLWYAAVGVLPAIIIYLTHITIG